MKKMDTTVKIAFTCLTSLLVGTVLVACAKETKEVVEISNTTAVEVSTEFTDELKESLSSPSDLEMTNEEDILSNDSDYTYIPSFTEEEAQEFIDRYVDVSSAHIEVYNPIDYSVAYYDLTDEQVSKVKDILSTATVDITKDSSFADFTTTLHMFDDSGAYVYVVALEADKETMYCEPGELKSENLSDYMEVLAMNAKLPELVED